MEHKKRNEEQRRMALSAYEIETAKMEECPLLIRMTCKVEGHLPSLHFYLH
jgi:hypothetical protein